MACSFALSSVNAVLISVLFGSARRQALDRIKSLRRKLKEND
jgi:hypothetical protein